MRLRPRHRGQVWSYDFVADRTHDGKAFRMLTVIDEHSRECLAIHVQRHLKSDDVLAMLADLFVRDGPPEHIRSHNGAEFTANAVRDWLGRLGVRRSTSNRDGRGRMATAKASTASCVMSCSTARSSIRFGKRRS